uniref:PDEase domain-containing protein n=1 Tax=Macrostomum lignano TaxID=282301 RepID=A0A1I8HLY6_9PLAT
LASVLLAAGAAACQYIRRKEPSDSLSWRGFITSVLLRLFVETIARYSLSANRKAYKSCSSIRAAQEKTLMRIVRQSRDTLFGRDHRFAEIHSIEDYRALVPVRDYAQLDKYNQLAYRGEPDVFFKGRADYLAKTSGTTGKNKTFPMAKRYRMQQIWGFFANMSCSEVFLAKVGRRETMAPQLYLAVLSGDRQNEFGIDIGPLSKYFFSNGEIYATPDEVFTRIHDSDACFYLHAVFALSLERIGSALAFFPTNLISFMRCLNSNWDSVLSDIENGKLNAEKLKGVDADLLSSLNQRLSPKPKRAAQLRSQFGDGKDLTGFFEKAWPNVPFVMLARSGSFQTSFQYLKNYLGNVPAFCPCIMGTEGMLGINLSIVGDDEPDRYHPMLTGSFFEFVPVDGNGNDLGEPKLAHELQVGCLYETVATSFNCFRLRVGDVIKVVDMDGCAPVFEMSHRKSHVLSVHVEKTTEKSLQAGAMLSIGQLGCTMVDFTATDCFLYEPLVNTSPGSKYYVLFVELDGDKCLNDEEKLLFDKSLMDSCENYKLFRTEGHIDSMQVVQVGRGAFADLRRTMMELNKDISETQFKMPRVLKTGEHRSSMSPSCTAALMENRFSLDPETKNLRLKRFPIPESQGYDPMGILDANYHGSAELLMRQRCKSWFRMDMFVLDRLLEAPLIPFCLHLFCDIWSFHRSLEGDPAPIVDVIKLVRLARTISEKYSSINYYHTAIHGMDVAQSMSCLLRVALKLGVLTLDRQELFIAVLSALMHDINHPGVTYDYFYDKVIKNFFKSKNMVSNENPLTDEPLRTSIHQRFCRRSSKRRYLHSLESHQANMSVSALLCSSLISHLPEQRQRQLCELMSSLVESTDMSLHQSLSTEVSRLATLFDSGSPPEIESQERLILLCFILKCSDISNPAKEWDYYFTWAKLITAEFFAQGDKERFIRGCLNPNKFVTHFCDRTLVNFEHSQVGFIKFIRESFQFLDSIMHCGLTRRILLRLDRNQQMMMKIRDLKKFSTGVDVKSPPRKLVVTLMLKGLADPQPATQKLKCCLLLGSRDRSSCMRRSKQSIVVCDKMQIMY